ncbi:hypothetical protein GWR56_15755 [Mucilaginibacter sp. 14171R-50]|uniref:hypothetical protein n=1 Tax=Mucilaginibacter sp. 14171R-50 TaxID=2703789 RepID=UPI00138C1020|nr:hypothetical protein [Mucilaginibacter sp. 14171R-50]QHS56930.1 hypothetical protein GWR56_15755 [Mucilaginibacter sp. 14171R-50]
MSLSTNVGGDTFSLKHKVPGSIPDIIGFNKWPSTFVKYKFRRADIVPQLQIVFSFDISRYQSATALSGSDTETPQWIQNAMDDLIMFQNIRRQLRWKYTPDREKPTEKLPVTNISLFTSLTPAITYPFSRQQTANTLAFINIVISWLQQCINSSNSNLTLKAPVSRSVFFALTEGINFKNVFEVETTLTITSVDTETGSPGPPSVTPISPYIGAGLVSFAKQFELVFKNDDCRLKLATGISHSGSNNLNQLWVIRIANSNTGTGIFYNIIAGTAMAIAPAPLSTTLVANSSTPIRPYKTGTGINWENPPEYLRFDGVDIDTWMREVLRGIDFLFTAAHIKQVFACNALYKLQHPEHGDLLNDIAQAKKGIISGLVNQLSPVIAGQTANLDDAAACLAQQLNDRLYNFYSTTAVVQYSVAAAVNGDTGIVKLLGDVKPVSIPYKRSGLQTHSASIKLSTEADGKAQSFLSFAINLKNPAQQTHLSFSAKFRPTQVDYTTDKGSNIILTILLSEPSAAFNADIPIVIREYPTPPTLVSQVTEKTCEDDAVTIPSALLWNYNCEYASQTVAQDVITAQLFVNEKTLPANAAVSGSSDLFESLAQFASVYPSIKTDLKNALRKIKPATKTDSINYKIALQALISFARLITNVKNALQGRRAKPAIAATTSLNNSNVFCIQETTADNGDDSRLMVTVYADKKAPKQVELPQVIIEGYHPTLAKTLDTEEIISKSYTYSSGTGALQFADTVGDRKSRLMRFGSFNAIQTQNLCSTVGICRNKNLLPKPSGGFFKTDNKFIYDAKGTIPSQRLSPGLSWAGVELNIASLNKGTTKLSLEKYLELFMKALTDAADDASFEMKMQVNYQYFIDEKGLMPPVTMPVLMVPPTMFLANDTAKQKLFATEVSGGINAWQEARGIQDYNPRYKLIISISSTADNSAQLFYLDSAYIDQNDIDQ